MSFSVTRTSQSFVTPSEPTPDGMLHLSVIDRVRGLMHMVRSLHVFEHGERPAEVIKEALSKALVKYYPFAGRFVEAPEHGGEVCVACTGEGAWFVEAEANCSLEDVKFLDFPVMIPEEELLPQPSPDFDLVKVPLMMQVTKFTCGGFAVGLLSGHAMTDGLGAGQFMNAMAEMARGLPKPTVEPVWSREVIPNPPKLLPETPLDLPSFRLKSTTIDISEDQINKIKASYFEHACVRCSSFDVVVAKLWQSRTRAIGLEPDADVHVSFFANVRHLVQHVLPPEGGYYGNLFYPASATAPSGEVAAAELVDVVKMVRDAKAKLPDEFPRWAVGEFKADDPFELTFSYNSLYISDWSKLGFLEVDYGWGKPIHVMPIPATGFMEVGLIGVPPAPKKGTRLTAQCVKEEHFEAFMEEMNKFD